jgi:hypothetical protein
MGVALALAGETLDFKVDEWSTVTEDIVSALCSADVQFKGAFYSLLADGR